MHALSRHLVVVSILDVNALCCFPRGQSFRNAAPNRLIIYFTKRSPFVESHRTQIHVHRFQTNVVAFNLLLWSAPRHAGFLSGSLWPPGSRRCVHAAFLCLHSLSGQVGWRMEGEKVRGHSNQIPSLGLSGRAVAARKAPCATSPTQSAPNIPAHRDMTPKSILNAPETLLNAV